MPRSALFLLALTMAPLCVPPPATDLKTLTAQLAQVEPLP